ncbi:putative N-acetylmannosamine-6-phosphate 2-epimerase [Micromonospora terminaliae]|uniref:N-acylglucosamine-6-phosphate 2-epimerase n=1 Tax=Micromonospora terminaliae TaxID=1914461 RepID=A0AAJ3DIJ3_9ACTN|nr:putative N-acetylmannosamine-6-phosphate 2-epimerase [Micromonospora terminaliae]NES27827.1 putative N-acetylmannosamine-6-phosphate 2-epimerase [Micromonospora terminaliae]QGL47394.1 putative N-acetylmannosamine-6-phosphate 2-epimerase [Micromonospora terminaliae]
MNALDELAGGLVVSCQPLPDDPDDPMRDPYVQARVAAAVVRGGAVAVRVNGPDDIAAVRPVVDVPLIGLYKHGTEGVFITPTAAHALDVALAGADIIAIDATDRPRPDGRTFGDTVRLIRERTDALILADISTAAEGVAAVEAGADAVATTLSGYTPASPPTDGPDLGLVARLVAQLSVPVIAEGRYRTTEQIGRAFAAGAHAVVMGNAVTSPLWITRRLVPATPRGASAREKRE